MAVHYRTRGFILKQKDLRDADQLFTVFSKDFGKLKILGRSIRKIKAKLRGNFRLFCLSEFEFIQGKTYKTLTDAFLIEDFSKLKEDLRKLQISYKIADLLDILVKGQEPDSEIWDLLNETLKILNNFQFSTFHFKLIYYYFLWNFLSILGYKPQLNYCSLCQQSLEPEKLYFSPKAGGIVCSKCYTKTEPKAILVAPDTVKILRLILERKYFLLEKLKIKKTHLENIKEASQKFLAFVLSQTR